MKKQIIILFLFLSLGLQAQMPIISSVAAPPSALGNSVSTPTLSSISFTNANKDKILIQFSDASLLNSSIVPASGDFSLSGTARTVSSVSVSSLTVTLTLSGNLAFGDNILVSYTQGTNKIQNINGGIAASFSNQAAQNQINQADETWDSKQVWMVVGDSKAAGFNSDNVLGPTVTAGQMWQWNRSLSAVTAVTNSDVLYVQNKGSQWPDFGIQYYSNTSGKQVVLVNNGVGGTNFYSTSKPATDSWYTNGSLYANAKSRTNACLTYLGLTKVKGVIILLGVNDINQGEAIDSIKKSIPSLIDRINADYGTPQIYISNPGISSAISSSRGIIAKEIKKLQTTYSNVHWWFNERQLYANGGSTAIPHFNSQGNTQFGRALANYVTDTESDRDVRRIRNGHFYTNPNSTKLAAYKTFILAEKAAGNWDKIQSLQIKKGDTRFDVLNDVAGIACPTDDGFTFTANANIETDGTSAFANTYFYPVYDDVSGQDDVLVAVGIGTVTTSAGTVGTLFGTSVTNRLQLHQKSNSTIGFYTNTNTEAVYSGITKFANNKDYALRRNASSFQELLENNVSVQTSSQGSTGVGGGSIWLGSQGLTEKMQVQYNYFLYTTNTGFNFSTFRSDIATLLSAL
jgi:hypothetical protein